MAVIRVSSMQWAGGATSRSRWPVLQGPEIALCGRSNVGKSTLINRMAGQHNLAHTSKTPGRTQQLNFYQCWLKPLLESIDMHSFATMQRTPDSPLRYGAVLTDLPGYGYAKVPEALLQQFRQFITSYLRGRDRLSAALLVIDARRITEQDEQMAAFCHAQNIRFGVVLTKADQVPRSRQHPSLQEAAQRLKPDFPPVLFSALHPTEASRDALLDLLYALWSGNPLPQRTAVLPPQEENPFSQR
ncbi:MAG: GTP-binding protein [Firmicutes bacterium]|nr:GTP-binding protein [Bacillota bacterium]